MKKILYVGNALSKHGNNPSSIETVGKLLGEYFDIIITSNKRNKIIRMLDMIYMLIKYRRKVDFVLIDTYSTFNFNYALIISQLSRVYKLKYIPYLKGGNLKNRLENSKYSCDLIFNNAHLIIAPSNFLKNTFVNYNYKSVNHIPNTVKIDQYDFAIRDVSKLKIIWLRAFSKIYNPSLAIKVINELRRRGYEAELCMVGPDKDGSMQSVKQLAEDLNLTIKITGKLSKPEWIALSKEYNLFINTTNYDNMPVSVIEMMALGIPVVSTNVGGMPFLIDDEVNGLLVEPDNINQMVEAVIRLHENPQEAKKLAKNAREKVEQYDWSVVKYQWKELLG